MASHIAGIIPPPIGFSIPLYADFILLAYSRVFAPGHFNPRRFIPVAAISREVSGDAPNNHPTHSAVAFIPCPIPCVIY